MLRAIAEHILLIFALQWWISQIAKFEDECNEAVVGKDEIEICLAIISEHFEGLY